MRRGLSALLLIALALAGLCPFVFGSPDTVTLRPSAVGTYTQWTDYPSAGNNYDKVDEETSDGDETYVYTQTGSGSSPPSYQFDSYNLPDDQIASGSTINNVTVYVRARSTSATYQGKIRTLVRTHSSNYVGNLQTPPTDYTLYSTTYLNNPNTGSAWTIDEIDALQIGEYGRSGYKLFFVTYTYYPVRCTQAYCVVDYTEPTGEWHSITMSFDLKTRDWSSIDWSFNLIARTWSSIPLTYSLATRTWNSLAWTFSLATRTWRSIAWSFNLRTRTWLSIPVTFTLTNSSAEEYGTFTYESKDLRLNWTVRPKVVNEHINFYVAFPVESEAEIYNKNHDAINYTLSLLLERSGETSLITAQNLTIGDRETVTRKDSFLVPIANAEYLLRLKLAYDYFGDKSVEISCSFKVSMWTAMIDGVILTVGFVVTFAVFGVRERAQRKEKELKKKARRDYENLFADYYWLERDDDE